MLGVSSTGESWITHSRQPTNNQVLVILILVFLYSKLMFHFVQEDNRDALIDINQIVTLKNCPNFT